MTEHGRFGSRSIPIGWGQEMSDQAALVREPCKWNYELRFPEQICDLADRAHAIAHSTPQGPIYLSLPREALCEPVSVDLNARRPQMRPAHSTAHADDMAEAARLIAEAERPVIFAQRGVGGPDGHAALAELTEAWGIPVCQYWATQLALDTTHPMAAGPDPAPLVQDADVILVIDALVPWAPRDHGPSEECRVIQLGQDPLFTQTPIRNFRADLSLPGEVGPNLCALRDALAPLAKGQKTRLTKRRKQVAETNRQDWEARVNHAEAPSPDLTKASVSWRLSALLKGKEATVVSELGCQLPFMERAGHDAWFESPHAGGLGFGLTAALGYALARPERLTVATIGDGSYMFANPVACHHVAQEQGISLLAIVLNNSEWGAVRHAVLDLYPDGHARAANTVPLSDLSASPDFARVAEAGGAWARRVDTPEDLDAALAEGLAHVEAQKGVALIDARVRRD